MTRDPDEYLNRVIDRVNTLSDLIESDPIELDPLAVLATAAALERMLAEPASAALPEEERLGLAMVLRRLSGELMVQTRQVRVGPQNRVSLLLRGSIALNRLADTLSRGDTESVVGDGPE